MKWRTEIQIKESREKYGYNHHFLLMGSCFSDEIGQRLYSNKFQPCVNPFGTIFNPIVLFEKIEKRDSIIDAQHFIQEKDLVFHYDYHSQFCGTSQQELIKKINLANQNLKDSIQKANVLVLTLGTAFVHTLKKTDKIVSNCHKQPSVNFTKRLLSVEEIVTSFKKLLHSFDTPPKIILTVSPVRHTKEGISENQLSKSILRVACSEICRLTDQIDYFPSYEVMIDDLRDYRFYKSDLIHPTTEAVDYIFEHFITTYFDKKSIDLLEKVKKINLDLSHRTEFKHSMSHQKFLQNLVQKLEVLNQTLDFNKEINHVKSQLL